MVIQPHSCEPLPKNRTTAPLPSPRPIGSPSCRLRHAEARGSGMRDPWERGGQQGQGLSLQVSLFHNLSHTSPCLLISSPYSAKAERRPREAEMTSTSRCPRPGQSPWGSRCPHHRVRMLGRPISEGLGVGCPAEASTRGWQRMGGLSIWPWG